MKCLLNVKSHCILNIQTFSVASNPWANSRIIPVGIHIHTHIGNKICLVMPAGRSQRDITVRYTHTPALLSSAPDSTQNAFEVISTSYLVFALNERISQHASLHFCLYLSIAPLWDTRSVSHCIVEPAAVSPWAMLRLAGDDVISSGELRSGACHWLAA